MKGFRPLIWGTQQLRKINGGGECHPLLDNVHHCVTCLLLLDGLKCVNSSTGVLVQKLEAENDLIFTPFSKLIYRS